MLNIRDSQRYILYTVDRVASCLCNNAEFCETNHRLLLIDKDTIKVRTDDRDCVLIWLDYYPENFLIWDNANNCRLYFVFVPEDDQHDSKLYTFVSDESKTPFAPL